MNTSHLAEGALGSPVTVLCLHGLLSVSSVAKRRPSGAVTASPTAVWLGAQALGQRCRLSQPTVSRTPVPDCPPAGRRPHCVALVPARIHEVTAQPRADRAGAPPCPCRWEPGSRGIIGTY